MQNLQNHTTTLIDPNLRSQCELYDLTKRLASGLPGLTGNTLLLLRVGVPTPSAGLAFPRALQEQIRVQIYLDIAPDKRFIRHVCPAADVDETAAVPDSGAGGTVYRLWISRLPIPHKHQVTDRVGFQ